MIPEIYVVDTGDLEDGTLLDAWRRLAEVGRSTALALAPDRLRRRPIGAWERIGARVCVIGSADEVIDFDADGLHLSAPTPSSARAARRLLGPERLIVAPASPGPPGSPEPWADVDGVDAWIVPEEADAARVPSPFLVRKSRSLAVLGDRIDDDEVRRIVAVHRGVMGEGVR